MAQGSRALKDTPSQNTPSEDIAADRLAIRKSWLVARSPVFYGWIVMGAAAIGLTMSSPGQTSTVSIFIEHFIEDLGISRSLVSTLYTIGTLVASFALPYMGQQIDRRGPRVMVGAITVSLALACVYMGFVRGAIMLGIGFVLIRMMAQGGMIMVCNTEVNLWWVRRRGTVLAIAGVLHALLGSGSFPSLVHMLIGQLGWRSSSVVLGIIVAAVMLPVGLILFRRQPEEYGLRPDGAQSHLVSKQAGPSDLLEENWSRPEALRTSAFWIISLGAACIAMLMTGLQFHMVSVFADAGLSASAAAAAFMPIAIAGSVFRLAGGVLVDRVPARFLLCVALLGQALSLVMAPRLEGTTSALVYGVVLGLTVSLQMTVENVVWAQYFGRRHLGSITGVARLVGNAGSALGPMPMGIARDVFGNYTWTLTLAAVLPLALAVLVLFARRPRKDPLPRVG